MILYWFQFFSALITKVLSVWTTVLCIKLFFSVFTQNLIGEWTPVEGSEIQGPAKDNAVLGHIIHRLFNIVSPPEVE